MTDDMYIEIQERIRETEEAITEIQFLPKAEMECTVLKNQLATLKLLAELPDLMITTIKREIKDAEKKNNEGE